MDITVTGRRVTVTDPMREYAEEKIGAAMKVMNISPLEAEVVLMVERNRSIARPCVCEVTLRTKGHVIRVEEHEEDMYAAIDVAAAKVVRQMRKFKTRVVDRRQRGTSLAEATTPGEDLDLDNLMAELSGEDDSIVREKEIEFTPLTTEQALIEIDLLGHDFYAYTDAETGRVNVLYRRKDGGYGLLKQAAE